MAAINKSGGIKVGDKSYKIEIKFYDDKSSPSESAKLIEKLITEDKVNFLLGPYSSGVTIPDSIVAQRYKIPMVEGGGASGKIFSRNNPFIFGTPACSGSVLPHDPGNACWFQTQTQESCHYLRRRQV